jgi:hypothetical protein
MQSNIFKVGYRILKWIQYHDRGLEHSDAAECDRGLFI